jgi:hypothetical protein
LRRSSTEVSIEHAREGKVTDLAQDKDERRRKRVCECRLLELRLNQEGLDVFCVR